MPSADLVLPARMSRVAVVSPRTRTRDALVELAQAGCVELVGSLPPAEGEEAEALRRLDPPAGQQRSGAGPPRPPPGRGGARAGGGARAAGRRGRAQAPRPPVRRPRQLLGLGRLGADGAARAAQRAARRSRLGRRRAAAAAVGRTAHAPAAGRSRAALPPARADLRHRALPRPRPDPVHGRLVRRHVRDDVRRRRARPRALRCSRSGCARRRHGRLAPSSTSG